MNRIKHRCAGSVKKTTYSFVSNVLNCLLMVFVLNCFKDTSMALLRLGFEGSNEEVIHCPLLT